ncbi:hypothetical protein BGZ95_009386 [Linnemannia exigua]|uniref:Uncharacterized protein n=1 Tax=Linnemannia exigua TaxID=604196 RepID=A0AAD4H7X3_9FUNG|nr:hypothetical protein BGZ95_009386 [Linnemannia exigua]
MFTPAPEKEKERVVSKTVRITVDGGIASAANIAGSTTYPRIPAQTATAGENITGMLPRRELSHGRKAMNRISLGSGFYASIEPVSLSNATPSTPKTRRQLVRLPARPQSVLIPSTAHHFPGSGSSNQSGAVNQLNGTRLGAGLQPISTEEFKRRRHKSQQLDVKGDLQRAVPIPWRQLAPMGAQENAKTFHGIGSAPAAPIPNLKKGASQEDTFGGQPTATLHPLNEAPEPARSPGSSSTLGSSKSRGSFDYDSRSGTPTRRSRLASEVVVHQKAEICQDSTRQSEAVGVGEGDSKDDSRIDNNEHKHNGGGGEQDDNDEDNDDDETNYSDENEYGNEYDYNDEEEEEGLYAEAGAGLNGSIVIQKSHVAVYEINARWGSRLMMFIVTLGGIICALSGGLCAEHHCKDLQLCRDEYQAHGDWCGPSGVEGAPYMLTVGLSMCIFGLYAMTHLRSPISRLVGYSEIDQFL